MFPRCSYHTWQFLTCEFPSFWIFFVIPFGSMLWKVWLLIDESLWLKVDNLIRFLFVNYRGVTQKRSWLCNIRTFFVAKCFKEKGATSNPSSHARPLGDTCWASFQWTLFFTSFSDATCNRVARSCSWNGYRQIFPNKGNLDLVYNPPRCQNWFLYSVSNNTQWLAGPSEATVCQFDFLQKRFKKIFLS